MKRNNNSSYYTDENTPFKWKKHLVLPFFGLRSIEDVESEIHRYKKQDLDCLVDDIKKDMIKAEDKNSYLISFVPLQQEYKLPNITVCSIEQLEEFKKDISVNKNNKFTEIWFFKKMTNKNSSNLVGRISFNLRDVNGQVESLKCAQILEQVWHINHREIERYNKESRTIFITASRMGWNRKYKIDDILIPKGVEVKKEDILKALSKAIIQIEANRENIEIFCEYVKKLGINEVSLEYMISNEKFSFIDWDSPNDKKIVNSIIKNRFKER